MARNHPLLIEAPGYRLQSVEAHRWAMTSPSGERYQVDMNEPFCDCKSREHPYCKHIRFIAGIYRVMVDIPEPDGLPVMIRRMEHSL